MEVSQSDSLFAAVDYYKLAASIRRRLSRQGRRDSKRRVHQLADGPSAIRNANGLCRGRPEGFVGGRDLRSDRDGKRVPRYAGASRQSCPSLRAAGGAVLAAESRSLTARVAAIYSAVLTSKRKRPPTEASLRPIGVVALVIAVVTEVSFEILLTVRIRRNCSALRASVSLRAGHKLPA